MWKKKLIEHTPYVLGMCCAVAITGMGMRTLNAYKGTISGLEATVSVQEKMLTEQQAKIDALTGQLAVASLPKPAPPTLATPPASAVEEVLAPQDDELSRIDAIKKDYEEILVTYFVLKQCNEAQDVQYHVINSALSQEIASLDAPGRLQYDILTSAQGSYNELYAGNPCDPATIEPLKAQFDSFVASISERFTPQ